MNWGLNKYSFGTMLRAWAIVLVLLLGPLLYFVKPRLPVSSSTHARRLNFDFLRTTTFWVFQAGNIVQGLGFFIPNIYLPTYARSLGLSPIAGTVTVSLFNTTSVFGQVILGSLSDRVHITTVILISTVGATLSVFFLWGLSASLPLLCIFSLVYGLFAGGFTSTYTGAIREVKKVDSRAEAGLVLGLLAAGRGVGSVVSGPLSEVLLSEKPWVGEAFAGYGSGYGGLIVFTGVSAMLSGVSWIGRRVGWI
jgi:MFS family permease